MDKETKAKACSGCGREHGTLEQLVYWVHHHAPPKVLLHWRAGAVVQHITAGLAANMAAVIRPASASSYAGLN